MAVDQIIEKINELTTEERREISVYLTKKQLEDDEGLLAEVRETMNDKKPVNWVNIRDVE